MGEGGEREEGKDLKRIGFLLFSCGKKNEIGIFFVLLYRQSPTEVGSVLFFFQIPQKKNRCYVTV